MRDVTRPNAHALLIPVDSSTQSKDSTCDDANESIMKSGE